MIGSLARRNRLFASIIVHGILLLSACSKPLIQSFSVTPLTMTDRDTVRLNWQAKGTPSILIHNAASADSTLKYMEVTLVAEKGSRQESRPVQVSVLPENSSTQIVFSTDLRGDTLVALGEKNIAKWGSLFEIVSVSSASARQLTVSHGGKTVVLDAAGNPSATLAATPVEGKWELRSLLTAEEKIDMSKAPETLQINATIKYKRR